MGLIDRQYTDRPFYGSRRVAAWLNLDRGEQVNRKRVQRLMRLISPGGHLPQAEAVRRGPGA